MEHNGQAKSTSDPSNLRTVDWLFVVCDPDDAKYLRDCEMATLDRAWLDVEAFSRKQIFGATIKGRKVIVIVPGEGAGKQQALEVAAMCRAKAAVVVPWEVAGLGSHSTPNLAIFHEKCDLEKTLLFDRPWESTPASSPPAASANGKPTDTIDYAALTDEELGLARASDIKVEVMRWLWKYRLARGEMALLAGEGGMGKSQMLMAIAAAISRGDEWPDGSGNAPLGSVLILSAEDSPSKTIVPRLIALKADLSRIVIQRAQVVIKREGKPSLVNHIVLRDLPYWRAVVERHKPVLLIVDPITSYLGRGVNDQKNSELRDILQPFIDEIAKPADLCFFANTHLNKSADVRNPMHRINGSIAYAMVPRNVHLIGRDPDDEDVRIFVQAKVNIAPEKLPGIPFRIETRMVDTEIGEVETCAPVFLEAKPVNVRTMFADEAHKKGPRPERSDEFADWLKAQLEGGQWTLRGDLINRAREANLLLKPTEDDRKPSVTPLYNAKDRISEKYPGLTVDARDSKRGEFPGNQKMVLWRLVKIEVES